MKLPINIPSRHSSAIIREVSILAALLCLLAFLSPAAPAADKDRGKTQQKLDAACEQAREARIAPMRQEKIEACVKSGEHDNREACEAEYSHFGQRAGKRPAMFYDLPECVEAFEFQKSYRKGTSD
ncbi:hypothetical protein [Thiolapillus brandeum]|uniref:Uncharacterized protein n=1 Tax=Thiolapillus brandeum TaxID=1076588 RepID=A0A7U6GK98_9GAMM|nr:hypothetical protein [Thiolapillus brandeum]BAO45210.1 conserved hypothetical protein [Thiolapillus brandeum]